MTRAKESINAVLHAQMAAVVERIEENAAERLALYDERTEIWQQAAVNGWTYREIGDASKATEGAVTQALHKARQQRQNGRRR